MGDLVMHGRSVIAAAACVCVLVAAVPASAGQGDARLADAAMRRDTAIVRTLIQQKADATAAQPDGMTALHWAARHDDLEVARQLIRAGARVDAATRYGVTPLYLACERGNAAMIDALLGAGANPNAATSGGETALMTAARTGRPDAVALLLDRGALVDARERARGQTALMWAVLEGHADVVRLLLARGANIDAQSNVSNPDGMEASITRADGTRATSAHIGAAGPGVYRARAIPSPSGGMTPLLFAAREGNLAMVRLLAESKAQLDLPSANGTTALVVAIVNNHIDVARYLLRAGANLNIADEYYKRAPLFAAIETRNLDFPPETPPPYKNLDDPLDLIRELLERGANPNFRTNTTPVRGFMQLTGSWVNFDGQTPFIRAALAGDVTVMRLLLEHGADPNLKTDQGTTALMAAAGVNWVIGQTFSRSDEEYLAAARLCLERGADVNAVNGQGFRAIHGAAHRGLDAMVMLLAERGALLDVKDGQGRTPMDFAEGVFLALQPPSRKPSTIALLQKLSRSAPGGAR
jgi:ankyrin repeat protein